MFEAGWAKVAVDVFQMVALGLLGLWSLNQKKHSAAAADIRLLSKSMNDLAAALKEQHARLETRVSVLETRIAAVPTHAELADIYDKLNEVRVGVGKLEGIMPGLNNMVGLMTSHLLEKRKEQ